MGAPGDRNLIDVFVQGGVVYKGPFGRDADSVGLAAEWAHIGARARAGDAAVALATGSFFPVRTSETVIEATYQLQVAPWWQIQPDLQYVFNPGGGLARPQQAHAAHRRRRRAWTAQRGDVLSVARFG